VKKSARNVLKGGFTANVRGERSKRTTLLKVQATSLIFEKKNERCAKKGTWIINAKKSYAKTRREKKS
jgi:hypothetical protein